MTLESMSLVRCNKGVWLLSTITTLISLGSLGPSQQQLPALRTMGPPGTAHIDMRTGVITRGSDIPPPRAESGGVTKVNCFANTDTSGYYSTLNGQLGSSKDEWLDWGVYGFDPTTGQGNVDSGFDLVCEFQFGYATNLLDTNDGGPGASIGVKFYDGAQGFCADQGLQPQASFVFTGLPAAQIGCQLCVGWVITGKPDNFKVVQASAPAVARVRIVAIGVRHASASEARRLKIVLARIGTIARVRIVALSIGRVATGEPNCLEVVEAKAGAVARIRIVALCVGRITARCACQQRRMHARAR